MHLRRLAPLLAGATLLLVVGDLGTLVVGQRWFATLIGNAVGTNGADTKSITAVTNGIAKIQGELQGFALGAAPLALAAAGLAWGAGHRRGVGMALAALGGLALAMLAGPIAK